MKRIIALLAGTALALTAFLALAGTASASVWPRAHSFCSSLVVFSFPRGSGVLSETQGPWLRVNEIFVYQGATYTITSVTHTGFLGHDQFRLSDVNGTAVVNTGPSIRHGEGHLPFAC